MRSADMSDLSRIRQRWQRTAIPIATAMTVILFRPALEAQAPRRAEGVLPRGAAATDTRRRPTMTPDSVAFVTRGPRPQDHDKAGAGLRVGWTIAGAVAGYLWWQSHRTEGNMMEPVEVVFLVGLGAVVGTIVGWIVE